MNRYQTRTPRLAFATVAVALTAITVALTVVAPARFDAADAPRLALRNGSAPTEVAIVPARIEVVGVRNPELAAARSGSPRS